ncbi:hypothetical protein [Saccharothrix stipae]
MRDPVCLRVEGAYRPGEPALVWWGDNAVDAMRRGALDLPDRWSSHPLVGYREEPSAWGEGRVRRGAILMPLERGATRRHPIRVSTILRPATAEEAAPLQQHLDHLRGPRELCRAAEGAEERAHPPGSSLFHLRTVTVSSG